MKFRRVTKAVSRILVSALFVQALIQPASVVVKASPIDGQIKQYVEGFNIEPDTGMTILKSSNVPNYYEDNYWNTLDKNKLPGTTVLASDEVNAASESSITVDSVWKGARLDESNFISAIQLKEKVNAQKSYFAIEDQMACLGAGINNVSDDTGKEVHTIIEDYKFDNTDKDMAVLRISKKSVKVWGDKFFPLGNTFTYNDVDADQGKLISNKHWAFILPAGSQSGNGYHFKAGERDLNLRFVESEDNLANKKTYLQLWLNHGTNNDAVYDYSIFKDLKDEKDLRVVRDYMDNNKAITIANNKTVQASFYSRTDTVAANIWADEGAGVEHDSISNFKVNAQSSVMMRKKTGLLEVAVSEPTGSKQEKIEMEIDATGYEVTSNDQNVTADLSIPGKIKLTIDTTGLNGATSKITISTVPPAIDSSVSSIDIVKGSSALVKAPEDFKAPITWTTIFKKADGTPIKNVGSVKKKDELKSGETDGDRSEGIAKTSHIASIEETARGGLITAYEKGVVYAQAIDSTGKIKEWKVNVLFTSKDKLPNVTPEDYSSLRAKWISILVGQNLDKDDNAIMETVNNINKEAQEIWNRYNYKGQDVCGGIPWPDEVGKKGNPKIEYERDAVEFRQAFKNVLVMAKAYRVEHGTLYNNQELLKDMINILDWLTTNCYRPQSQTDNWWTWEIGIPKDITPTLILLSDKLTKEQKEKFTEGVRFFQPDPYHGGAIGTGSTHVKGYRMQYAANRVDNSVTAMGLGLLLEDNEFMYLASLASSSVLEFASVKDSTLLARDGLENGFYKDGSYIDHSRTPYAGSYGVVVLEGIVNISSILAGSPWKFDAEKTEILETIFVNTYGISMYKGLMLEMLRGRAVARENVTGKTIGRQIMTYVIKTLDSVGEEQKAILLNCLKNWLSADAEYISTLKELNEIFVKQKAQEILNNSSISADLPSVHKNFPLMDRVIHRTKDWLFGLSMYSERILNTEIMNGENLYGWHQGDGMTYLYGKDNTQYTDNFWNTVNPFRLPGTTTVSKNIGNGVKDSSGFFQDGDYTSKEAWVGGSMLSGYGINGMSLSGENESKTPYEPDLKALKSYFMFDDEIVCLGAGINDSGSKYTTETTVENRKLDETAYNQITLNGNKLELNPVSVNVADIVKEEGLGTGTASMAGTDLNDTKWVHMDGANLDDSIGWYFPNGTNKLKARKVASTGDWGNIKVDKPKAGVQPKPVMKNYFELWFDHGNNPQNAEYSYVILPGKTVEDMKNYEKNPSVEILANTTDVQAVNYKSKNVIGANFWQDKIASVSGITCNKKASIMVKQTGDTLEIGVSDPTMKNTETIEVEIDKEFGGLVNADSNVVVSENNGKIHLVVSTRGKNGDTSLAMVKLKTTESSGSTGTPVVPAPDTSLPEVQVTEDKTPEGQAKKHDNTKSNLDAVKKTDSIKKMKFNFNIKKDEIKKGLTNLSKILVKKSILKEAAKKSTDLILSVRDENKKVLYSWSISGKELNKSKSKFNDINLSLKVVSSNKIKALKSLLKGKNGTVVSFSHKGKLPAVVTIKIYDAKKFNYPKNKKLYVYYYNEKKNRLEETNYDGGKVLKKGVLEFKTVRGADYVVLSEKLDKN